MLTLDPFYPTSKDPLDVSYKEWLIMMKNNPELHNTQISNYCTQSQPFSRSLYSELGVHVSCDCDKMYDINSYSYM